MSETSLVNIVEGALLAAGKPMSVANICDLFEEHEKPDTRTVREAMQEVAERCEGRGFELVEVASGFRFQVRQALSPWVGRLWHERPAKYSRALLETLSLIAYRQPITRGEIEEIRGVAVSSNIIKTLHEREWIRVVGHRDVPGRPAMYATTRQFLDYFNLKSLDQLPALAEIRDLETLNAELGFSDPVAEVTQPAGAPAGDEQAKLAPGLTVVGGTEHRPADATAAEPAAEAGEPQPDGSATGHDDTGDDPVIPEAAAETGAADTSAGSAAPAAVTAQESAEQVEPESAEALAEAMQDLSESTEQSDKADESVRPESQG